jgi:hypothetical protein
MMICAHGRICGAVIAAFLTIATHGATFAQAKEEFVWVPNTKVASGIAEAVLAPLFQDRLSTILPLEVELDGDEWMVRPKSQPALMDGGFTLRIDRKTGAIRMEFNQ